MRLLRGLGFVFLLLAVVIAVVLFVGSRLPRAHTASASVVIAAPQARVWALIQDLQSQPSWRTGLLRVETLPDTNGHRCWVEVQKNMRMPLCEDAVAAPSTKIVHITDPSLPFGGDWVYQLIPLDANSTRVLIMENGTVGPAMYRFVDHYIIHEDAQVKQYESDLQKAVGQGK